MKNFRYLYGLAAILFLIGCLESFAAISNNLSSDRRLKTLLLTMLIVAVTLGLGVFSYTGFKSHKNPSELSRVVRIYGYTSIVFSLSGIAFLVWFFFQLSSLNIGR